MSKIKNGGLDQYGAGAFKHQQFGTAGVKGLIHGALIECKTFGPPSVLSLHTRACTHLAGYAVLSVWSWQRVCAPDSLSWNISFIVINLVQVLVIASRLRPICLSPHLHQLYTDVFRPLNMSRFHFFHFSSHFFQYVLLSALSFIVSFVKCSSGKHTHGCSVVFTMPAAMLCCRNSVSIRPSVSVLCDKRKTADILIPHETAITVVFRHQQWLVGDVPFRRKFALKVTPLFETRRLRQIFAYNV